MLQDSLGAVMGIISAQNLSFIYPLILSFVEYVIVSKVFRGRVVEEHCDALSIVAGC